LFGDVLYLKATPDSFPHSSPANATPWVPKTSFKALRQYRFGFLEDRGIFDICQLVAR
jgi:hypothetical protein